MPEYLPTPGDLLALLPGAALGLVLLLVSAARSGKSKAWWGALAGVAPVFATWLWTHGGLPFPPGQSSERAVWGCLGWAAVLAATNRAGGWRVALWAAAATGWATWILWPLVRRGVEDPGHVSVWTCAIVGSATAALAWAAGGAARRVSNTTVALTSAIALGATGQVLVLFGSASLAQLTGSLSITLVAAALLLDRFRGRPLPHGIVAAALGAGVAIAVDGRAFLLDKPPLWILAALGVVPCTAWLAAVPAVRNTSTWRRAALVLGVAALVAGAAVAGAVAAMPESDPYADPYK